MLRERLPSTFRVISVAWRWRPTRTFGCQILVPLWARILDLHLLHSTGFVVSFACRRPQVLTIYDMTFYSLPHPVRPPVGMLFRHIALASIRRAHHIVVPSKATQLAVQRFLPEVPVRRLSIVPLGVDTGFRPATAEEVSSLRRRVGIDRDYILFVGTLEPRKNLATLVRAYAMAVARGRYKADLVLAGQWGWHTAPLKSELRALPPGCRVHLLDYVPEADLPPLYSGARLFVYPSIEEGFGLPPLEAMACGVPVVSSDRSSMPEVLGDAARLVDPRDEAGLADAICDILNDERQFAALRRAGLDRAKRYRWSRTAAQTVAVYEHVAAEEMTGMGQTAGESRSRE